MQYGENQVSFDLPNTKFQNRICYLKYDIKKDSMQLFVVYCKVPNRMSLNQTHCISMENFLGVSNHINVNQQSTDTVKIN